MPNAPAPVIPDAPADALHGTRRRLLASTALALFTGSLSYAAARTIAGQVPWIPFAATPPEPVQGEGWVFFTPEEAAIVEAIVERLIPADDLSPSGKDAGCAVFIDRQLAGPFGDSRKLYMKPPFRIGITTQGLQSGITPAQRYRVGLAALNARCRQTFAGKSFAELDPGQRDGLLREMQGKRLNPADVADMRALFELLLQNTQKGFFAGPIYGGNRGMAGWKMIGFPGYLYDYRDYIRRYNEDYKLPPLAIGGRPAWNGGDALMPTRLRAIDAVVIGLGWAGSILTQELTGAGLNVIALERDGRQDTAANFNVAHAQDELRYVQRQQLLQQTAQTTITFRNRVDQVALPIRQ